MSKSHPGIDALRHCVIHAGSTLPQEAFDTPLECRRCGARVPASAAIALGGTDYLWHFCGHDCLARWCTHIEHHQE
jgi:hypothetical protein